MNNFPIVGISGYSSHLKLCVYDGKNLRKFSTKEINFDKIIVSKTSKLLKDLNYSFRDIKKICIIRGPGRFTAIRTVYTFASVYSALSGCSVFGVDIFECLSYKLFEKDKSDKKIAVISHAFKDEYYIAFYNIKNGGLKEKVKPIWLKINQLKEKLLKFNGYIVYDSDEVDVNVIDVKMANIFQTSIEAIDVIKACDYFKKTNYEPIYLKPAKFEV